MADLTEDEKNKRMLEWFKAMIKAESLSDGELIDEVYDRLGNTFDICSYEQCLLDALLDRFQIKAEILVTPKGITVDGEDLETEWAEEII